MKPKSKPKISKPANGIKNSKVYDWEKSLKERFEDRIYHSLCGCWLWTGRLTKKGYGTIWGSGGNLHAHRASFMLYKGEIPDGLHVLHTCDVRNCVNPDHLFLGTNLDNIKDKVLKNRTYRGENHYRSKLTESILRDIRFSKSVNALANRFGVHKSTISAVRSLRLWKHVQ